MTKDTATTAAKTTTYPKEMQVYLLQNCTLIETGSLTDAVEEVIFAAIHERIAQKLERRIWEAHYDALNDSEDSYEETLFAPLHWPKRSDASRQAYYRIAESGPGNNHWLSSLLGLNETQACFELYIDGRLGGPRINVKERVKDFYAQTPSLHELGFACTADSELRLPFRQLAAAYPDLRKPMMQFEAVFDKLLKANELIDKLILGMVPGGAQKPEDVQK